MIREDKIIETLRTSSSGFIGDDATMLPGPTNGQQYVISKDILVEDVHFRSKYFTAQDLAHKALHVNLSDIAAMGAQPLYILCGISIPDNLQNYALDFLSALTLECKNNNVILIGGDTTSSKQQLFISITAIGQAREQCLKYRNNASAHQLICVAGDLGFAHLGLIGLETSVITSSKYTDSFLRPRAKIQEGIWLGQQAGVTCMMDISDGLYIDLKRLCAASNKGAEIYIENLESYLEPEITVQIALQGGEDYGLLLCVQPNEYKAIAHQFKQTFGYSLKLIGEVTHGNTIVFKKLGEKTSLSIKPFSHFGEELQDPTHSD